MSWWPSACARCTRRILPRCLDTVRPFAHRRHATVAHEPLLSEEGFTSSQTAAFMRVDQILADAAPVVVCTHRPVLPPVIKHVAERLGIRMPSRALAPGAALVFHRGIGVVEHIAAF